MRLVTYQTVYWHKQNDAYLIMPRGPPVFLFSSLFNVFYLLHPQLLPSNPTPPRLVVAAKVREAHLEKKVGSQKGGRGKGV